MYQRTINCFLNTWETMATPIFYSTDCNWTTYHVTKFTINTFAWQHQFFFPKTVTFTIGVNVTLFRPRKQYHFQCKLLWCRNLTCDTDTMFNYQHGIHTHSFMDWYSYSYGHTFKTAFIHIHSCNDIHNHTDIHLRKQFHVLIWVNTYMRWYTLFTNT